MINARHLILPFAALLSIAACNNIDDDVIDNGEPTTPTLLLTADRESIVADGEDAVTFSVTAENILTEDMPVIINLSNASEVGERFSTTTAGSYSFQATKGGIESNIVTITATAVAEPEPEPEPEPTPPSGEYAVGDIYVAGGVKGLVFHFHDKPLFDEEYNTIGTITYGYVMSLDEGYEAWATESGQLGCFSSGKINTELMVEAGIEKYPAAKWCVEHGEGWFLPSGQEMGWMWDMLTEGSHDFYAPSVERYNTLFTEHGGDVIEEAFYWTSGEINDTDAETFAFMERSYICDEPSKYKQRDIRAVYMFEAKRELMQ